MALLDQPVKTVIADVTLSVMLGLREGVGRVRTEEFRSYIDSLIIAKEGNLDVATLPWPMLLDNTKQAIDATLAVETQAGVSGGLQWSIISLTGGFGKEQAEGIRVQVEMQFTSPGAPALEIIRAMSVEELQGLRDVMISKNLIPEAPE